MKIAKWQLLFIPFFIAGGFALYGVLHYGVNTPLWDEWSMVPLFQKVDHHSLGLSDLWAQHNEHRVLFPNMVLLVSAYATHWNIKAETLVSFVFSGVTALMLYLFVLSKLERRYIALAASVLIAAWFYSPIQHENWLLGWQVEWPMCVAGIVTAMYCIDRFSTSKHGNHRLLFGLAVASAIVATYSLGGGLLVWPVGLGMLVLYKQTRRLISVWLAAAVLSISAYYYGYHAPAGSPPTGLFIHQPLNFIKYVLSYIGSAIYARPGRAVLIGAVLVALLILALYMVWLGRSRIEKFVPWLGLIALALMAAAITGIGRLGFGVAESMSSRYTAFSLLYVIGLTGLICAILDTLTPRQGMIGLVIMSISIPLLFVSYSYGMLGLKSQSASLQEVKYCTHQPDPDTACLLLTAPYPDRNTGLTGNQLKYIKAKHWAGY